MGKSKPPPSPPPPPPRASLGDLLKQQGFQPTPAAPPDEPRSPPVMPAAPPDEPRSPPVMPAVRSKDEVAVVARAVKLVIRRERKGHGGKTVTVIEGLVGRQDELEALCRQLRSALGCGGSAEKDRIVLQGDLGTRLESWLRAHGAARVVQGSG